MTRHDTYAGPKPALHSALTSLAYALDPWYGILGLTAPADPEHPFGPSIRLAGPEFRETPEQADARRADAVTRFRAGLAALSARGDRDARRIEAALIEAETLAGDTADHSRRYGLSAAPRYGTVVHEALARLEADAEGIQPGDDTRWCSTCATRRVLVETDTECSTYEGAHEMGWTAYHLACGHTEDTDPRIIGRSPGWESAAEVTEQAATRRRVERTAALADTYGDL